jgi:hypothetical protein
MILTPNVGTQGVYHHQSWWGIRQTKTKAEETIHRGKGSKPKKVQTTPDIPTGSVFGQIGGHPFRHN